MSKLSTKEVSASITGGYVHIILPDINEPTGFKSYRIKLEDFTSGAPAASAVSTNTTNFDGNLSSSDDTVQKALDTLDEMIASGTDELVKYDAGDTTAGYLGAKIVAGTGISIAEGTGGDENKVKITNTVSISGLLDETAHDLLDHTGLTGIPSISGLLDETAHDLLDHTGLTGVGSGDMVLASVQSVTGEKVFDSTKASVKGSSTGKNIIAAANSSATDYTNTLPAKTGTFAMDNVAMFDATIGAGGEYADIAAAQTAGKYRLLAVGTITVTTNTTLTNAMFLDLNGYTLAFGAFILTKGTGGSIVITCSLKTGNITFGYSSAKQLFNSFTTATLMIKDIGTITNSSTINGTLICEGGNFSNLTITLPNYTYGGFGNNTLLFVGILQNIVINSQANSQPVYTSTEDSIINGLKILGNAGTILFQKVSNLYVTGTCTCYIGGAANNITLGSTSTLNIAAGGIINNFRAPSLGANNGGKLSNGAFSGNCSISSTSAALMNNISFGGTLTISCDYQKLIGCVITGLLTLSSGAEYNVIEGNTLTGGLVDNSGNTTNIIKNNI